MAVYNLPNYTTADGFGMSLNIRRGNPNPLDNSSVWRSYADALNYAKTDPTAYVGQILSVVTVPEDETIKEHKVDVYKIELDADGESILVKVGVTEEVADLDTEVQGIKFELSTFNSHLNTVEDKVETIKNDLKTANNDINKAEETIAANAKDITSVKDDVAQLKTDVGNAAELAANNKTRLDQFDTQTAKFATKDEVAEAKSEAIADAKTETEYQISAVVSQYLTGEGAADTIDTLQEIVDWLNTDGSGADKIVADIEAIKDDYLKGADKTELNKAITDLSTYVGTLPEGATSTTVVAYIQEVVDGLKIDDYAKASDLTALADRVTAVENTVKALEKTRIPGLVTEINNLDTRVKAVEEAEHKHENILVLNDITADKVSAWDDTVAKKHEHTNKTILDAINPASIDTWNSVTSKANSADLTSLESRVSEAETTISSNSNAISEKVDKKAEEYTNTEGVIAIVEHRLLTPAEQEKLSKLVLNADGSVETGTSVAAGDVVGLAQWLKDNAPTNIENLTKSNLSDELVTQIESAINEITVNGLVLSKTDGKVDIPIATATTHGTVMLGAEFKLAESGAMEVNSINVNKLSQNSGEVLELNGGNAAGSFE